MFGITFDIILVVLIIIYGLFGYFNGFCKSFLNLFGVGFSLIITILLRNEILQFDARLNIFANINLNPIIKNIIILFVYGIIIYIFVKIVASIINVILNKVLKVGAFNSLNKVLGFVFGLLRGAVVLGVILFIFSKLQVLENVREIVDVNMQSSKIVLPIIKYFENFEIFEFINIKGMNVLYIK